MKNTLKKEETDTSPLEIEPETGVQETKKEDSLDKSEPAASSIEENCNRKLVKGTAPSCFIYAVNFKNSRKEHELGVVKDLTGKVNTGLADNCRMNKKTLKP